MVLRTYPKIWLAMAVFLLGFGCAVATGGTIYIDANAPPEGDGQTWATAYKYLQDALHACSNPDVNQIWVAAGTYYPDADSSYPGCTNNREATFQLINGVAIYGGFPSGGGWRAFELIIFYWLLAILRLRVKDGVIGGAGVDKNLSFLHLCQNCVVTSYA